MSEDKLRDALEALRGEISRLEGLDDQSRARLDHLLGDIELKVKQPQDAAHHENLIQRLQDSVSRFEVSHPNLTMALNEVLNALSGAGV